MGVVYVGITSFYLAPVSIEYGILITDEVDLVWKDSYFRTNLENKLRR